MEKKQPFKALSKICLNNWHYIDRKILSFSEGVNFFTGHSGSGKSTVIDAIQIVLYANTDGRGFFNKAAADDSDRSLIEYLRGMVNIGENNESEYLRNKNFSSTIVLEFEQTDTREKQCVGVVFDVETSTNEIGRLFFWHTGGLLENQYRADRRCLTTGEVREYLQRSFPSDQYYCGPSNERFRRQLYDIYLGGLDMEKFPRLFKRAIPFRMNIKLEDFVKEYICMEKDIHIEDLQESVMQYGRMRSKIEETMCEVGHLQEIAERYADYAAGNEAVEECDYEIEKLEILQMREKVNELKNRITERAEEQSRIETMKRRAEEKQEELRKEYEEVILRIADSGYSALKKELAGVNETLERLGNSRARWQKTAEGLAEWKQKDVTPNQTIWDIERFEAQDIDENALLRLKQSLASLRGSLEEDLKDAEAELKEIRKEEKSARDELKALRQGKKAYPRELEEARYELRNRLREKCGRVIPVQILADLLDVRDETWHNAVEGYLGNNKLLLVVEPAYAGAAMEVYRDMDKKRYSRAALLDTEKALEYSRHSAGAVPGSLAEEVTSKEDYIKAYVEYVLGSVMKCSTVEELRLQKIGITPDCMLYKGFRLQYINPDNYTRRAFIGETSTRQRIRRLEKRCQELQEKRIPLQEMKEEAGRMLRMESLAQPEEDYLQWMKDIDEISKWNKRKIELSEEIIKLRGGAVSVWEEKKEQLLAGQDEMKESLQKLQQTIWKIQSDGERYRKNYIEISNELNEKEKGFQENDNMEIKLKKYLENKRSSNLEYLRQQRISDRASLENARNNAYSRLVERRTFYLKSYPNRTFSAMITENDPYDRLLSELQCDELEEYRQAAREQARTAVGHFKEDFIYKIRSAILEAYQMKDELNRIISRLDFGKDKYQFAITKNKGPDGRFYKMFMDDSLSINPAQLSGGMENQLNMFTMEHEEEYGEMMNELINIFIPPEDAAREELEEAKKNMEKYADYRTYLSFDMQQIIHGDKEMKIGLSRMIRKNSGGEGQNPLYIALLASFAQVYRINLSPKIRRAPTIRLVVLDEAFSKMDAEKVASCISLIRGLGFQAVISATNDKIQNYLENVDKTFVYANPNKKHISIQEFEREDYDLLRKEETAV